MWLVLHLLVQIMKRAWKCYGVLLRSSPPQNRRTGRQDYRIWVFLFGGVLLSLVRFLIMNNQSDSWTWHAHRHTDSDTSRAQRLPEMPGRRDYFLDGEYWFFMRLFQDWKKKKRKERQWKKNVQRRHAHTKTHTHSYTPLGCHALGNMCVTVVVTVYGGTCIFFHSFPMSCHK